MGLKPLFTHPILSVLQRTRLLHGTPVTRTYVDMAPAVMVLAIDKANNIHFIREYMAPADQHENTFVKGRIDEGETPHDAAARELAEELGLQSRDIQRLLTVCNQPSHSTAVTHIFVARDCTPLAATQRPPGDEEAHTLQPTSMPYGMLTRQPAAVFRCVRCIAALQALRLQDLERGEDRP